MDVSCFRYADEDDHGAEPPTDIFLIPVVTPIFFGQKGHKKDNDDQDLNILIYGVWVYSIFETTLLTLLMLTITEGIFSATFPKTMAICIAVFAAMKICCSLFLIWVQYKLDVGLTQLTKEKSSLSQLLSLRLYADALELILFSIGSISGAVSAEFKDGVKFSLRIHCLFVVLHDVWC